MNAAEGKVLYASGMLESARYDASLMLESTKNVIMKEYCSNQFITFKIHLLMTKNSVTCANLVNLENH